jgi:hypothetical protein
MDKVSRWGAVGVGYSTSEAHGCVYHAHLTFVNSIPLQDDGESDAEVDKGSRWGAA